MADFPVEKYFWRMTTQLQFNLMPERRIWSVNELSARIRDVFARNFTDILVRAKFPIAGKRSLGHIDRTLKDERGRYVRVLETSSAMKFRTGRWFTRDGPRFHQRVRGPR